MGGCYSRARRAGCNDYCADHGDVFCGSPSTFSGPIHRWRYRFVCPGQIGFLDEITQLLNNNDSPFMDAVNGAIGALGDAASFLANIQEILETFPEYLDRFTDGYHLGAYDTQRPDLHMPGMPVTVPTPRWVARQ